MVITVTNNELAVIFGYVNLIKTKIALSDINSAEVVTFRPIRDFGGWGIKCGRFRGKKTLCLSLKGNKGVLLTLRTKRRVCLVSTNRLVIANLEPERLKAAIAK